ncbi:MAG: hypothetical protein KBC62_04395 [Candidatus Pacebacteria bacterium]|nr:hypothetical protein [Candidatus Paceibacterota bacterium]
MKNQNKIGTQIFALASALQIGSIITGISYLVGNKIGFNSFILTEEVLNSVTGYDNLMSAFFTSASWQIVTYMILLLAPKWFIYQDKSKKLWFSLLLYWVFPFVVWVSLDGIPRFIGFTLIATMVWFEGVQYLLNKRPSLK